MMFVAGLLYNISVGEVMMTDDDMFGFLVAVAVVVVVVVVLVLVNGRTVSSLVV